MARIAVSRRRSVVAIRMALSALHRCMHSGQWILRVRRVIEGDGGPVRCAMAGFAGRGESRRGVIWICRPLPVVLMAPIARGGQCLVIVVRVTLRALHRCMRSGQWEHRRVIES